MKDLVRINMLLDLYGNLLTKHQSEVLNLYIDNDYSLSEIAKLANISRQGVYDNIKRAKKQLEEYEEKLNLLSKLMLNRKRATEAIKNIENNEYTKVKDILLEIVER